MLLFTVVETCVFRTSLTASTACYPYAPFFFLSTWNPWLLSQMATKATRTCVLISPSPRVRRCKQKIA